MRDREAMGQSRLAVPSVRWDDSPAIHRVSHLLGDRATVLFAKAEPAALALYVQGVDVASVRVRAAHLLLGAEPWSACLRRGSSGIVGTSPWFCPSMAGRWLNQLRNG